ncbi:hypothetical protein WQ96_04835 [Escherichia coli]|nr:hypothetical protein WQ96_04835 [Escherichia coli]
MEGLNDRVLRARSEFCLIIAELSGRRHAYITSVIPFIIFLVSSGCALRSLFLRPATGRWSSCDLIPVPAF